MIDDPQAAWPSHEAYVKCLEQKRELVPVGEYVLATKYDDGDPCDHFFIGFVSGYTHHGRYLIVDNDGRNQRHNGFRRAEPITAEEGAALVAMIPEIANKRGPSLWWHLDRIRGGMADVCPVEMFDWV
jgi:hypothetical protein